MRKRRLGRTNWLASEISLGTVELGLNYGIAPVGADARPDYSSAERLLHHALDLGVNVIDTARGYGESEAVIGRALQSRRSEFFLASKVSTFEREGLSGDALADAVSASVHASLRALRTDTIDLMLLHTVGTAAIERGEVVDVLEKFRQAGHLRFLGASIYGEESALLAIRSGRYDCLQIAYNALDHRPEGRLLQEAQARDIAIVVRSVLLKGALTHRYRLLPGALAGLKSAVERLQALGEEYSLRLPELAYRFVLSHPGIHTALVGTGAPAELEAAIGYAARGPLPDALCERIRAISVADESNLNPGTWPI
jgi:1-deoxyxylulose-5-phosphate synthase